MRYPSHVSATSWYLGAQCRWQFVLVTYMSLWPFSSNLYGFYHFLSLFQGPCCVWARGWHDMLGWAHGRSFLNSNPIHWEEQKGKNVPVPPTAGSENCQQNQLRSSCSLERPSRLTCFRIILILWLPRWAETFYLTVVNISCCDIPGHVRSVFHCHRWSSPPLRFSDYSPPFAKIQE